MTDIDKVISFIQTSDIPARKRKGGMALGATEEPTIDKVLDTSKDQALVVGSDIVSFATGLSAELRESVTNCSLLAQLVANKKVPSKDKIEEWYQVYFDSLTQLGWAIQSKTFLTHNEAGDDFEAHNAIIAVATAVLGGAATALALVTTTLKALKEMSDSPWIRLFKRESQTAKAARFQITVAQPIDKGAMVSLMAFTLHAKSVLTQVLFFKFRSTDVTLKHASGTLTLNADLLLAIKERLAEKVKSHSADWIEAVGEL